MTNTLTDLQGRIKLLLADVFRLHAHRMYSARCHSFETIGTSRSSSAKVASGGEGAMGGEVTEVNELRSFKRSCALLHRASCTPSRIFNRSSIAYRVSTSVFSGDSWLPDDADEFAG